MEGYTSDRYFFYPARRIESTLSAFSPPLLDPRLILNYFFISLLLLALPVCAEIPTFMDLSEELALAQRIDWCRNHRLPAFGNMLLQRGYIAMPSARTAPTGTLAVGYSHNSPYDNYNIAFQPFDRLELTANYRVFRHLPDPVLAPFGFGELADRGLNLKFAIIRPEESEGWLPGVAIGWDDITGTRSFNARYLVFTKLFPQWNLELSVGAGKSRIKGPFGAATWTPFFNSGCELLKQLALTAEYDATNYRDPNHEPHPRGRSKKSPINLGLHYRWREWLEISAAWVRGKVFSFAFSVSDNIGNRDGWLPRCDTPPCTPSSLNLTPLTPSHPAVRISEIYFALSEGGITLLRAWFDACGALRLRVFNALYPNEYDFRAHLDPIIAAQFPENLESIIVEVDMQGISIQEYHFRREAVERYRQLEICTYEFSCLSPRRDSAYCPGTPIFRTDYELSRLKLSPRYVALYGSSEGKFKYALGVAAHLRGFLPYSITYALSVGSVLCENMPRQPDDCLNPSQLKNVHSDLMLYFAKKQVTLDEAYLQKIYSPYKCLFARIYGGIFSIAYGGAGVEWLYAPVNTPWAVGIETSWLQKRHYSGVGFYSRIRKLKGNQVTYVDFLGIQAFLDLYFEIAPLELEGKISVGRFLAGDYGARFEGSRVFCNGMRIGVWYTVTNANDQINGKRYFDKGLFFSIPLEWFCTRSCRDQLEGSLSAWLRDVGFRSRTGRSLFESMRCERR